MGMVGPYTRNAAEIEGDGAPQAANGAATHHKRDMWLQAIASDNTSDGHAGESSL
jgi:hypothetical protein